MVSTTNSHSGTLAHKKCAASSSPSSSSSSSSSVSPPPSAMGYPSSLEMGLSTSSGGDAKSSRTTPTCVESSEEFTLSAELSAATAEGDEPMLQLSGLSIVEETSSKQQPERNTSHGSSTTDHNDNNHKKIVQFANDVTYIDEKDLFVARNNNNTQKRKSKKKKKHSITHGNVINDHNASDDDDDQEVRPEDLYWSQEELQKIETNAMYMVKECQQYQEEVICTVLYNKAFLTAANLAKTIREDELQDRLQDIRPHTQNLESWTAVGQCRRGLENMVSEKSMVNAIQARKDVLQYQKELKEASTSSSSSSSSSTDQLAARAELLAQRCQDSSRTARIMARMMGQADRDSLDKAESLLCEVNTLPEPPGLYDNYDYHREPPSSSHNGHNSPKSPRRSRRESLLKPIKKAFGAVLRRHGSEESQRKRIVKMQQKQMERAEPEPSQEFRRSFLDGLEYGEQ